MSEVSAPVVRERALMEAKIRAISLRRTTVIMLCFPGLHHVRTMMPDYFDPLWGHGFARSWGRLLMAIGVPC
jgi:Flp pilus assembly protein TadB